MSLGNLYSLPPNFFEDAGQLAPEQELSLLDINTSSGSEHALGAAVRRRHTAENGCESSSGGPTCQACGIGVSLPGFASAAEQREHFKTDWHRYNVKRRVAKQPPVSEAQFEQLLEDESEVSSISGSSSEDEDDGGHRSIRQQQQAVPPQVVFTGKDGKRFCVWKALVERDSGRKGAEPPSHAQLLSELKQLRASQGLFVVILLRGGHFAASVFKAKPAEEQKGRQGGKDDVFEVLDHKTCHRYVIRAKAGGRQSTKDNTGKNIKSAGALLRRHNEAALDADVANVMSSWSHYLKAADRIFVQFGSADAKSIFTADAAPQHVSNSGAFQGLSSSDPRVRRIPFATQRPTFSESRRVIGLLVSVFEPSAGFLAAEQAAADAAAAAERQRQQRRLERKQQKEQALQQPQQEQEQLQGDDSSDEEGSGCCEQRGEADRVSTLLSGGADVTARDSRGRTPYLVASSKEVRDAFRRFMAAEPDKWDYNAAGIPSALTDEMEVAQAAKKAEKKARQKAKEQERKAATNEKKKKAEETSKAALDDEIARAVAEASKLTSKMSQPASSASTKVGGSTSAAGPPGSVARGKKGAAAAASAAAAANAKPLTPEELARRRELQAQAAENRMKALQAASQQQQLY